MEHVHTLPSRSNTPTARQRQGVGGQNHLCRSVAAGADVEPQTGFCYRECMGRLDDDEELFVDLVALFQRDYPCLLAGLRDAVLRGDAVRVEQDAHALKGMVAAFGAAGAAAEAGALECMGRASSLEGAEPVLCRLTLLVRRLERELVERVPPSHRGPAPE